MNKAVEISGEARRRKNREAMRARWADPAFREAENERALNVLTRVVENIIYKRHVEKSRNLQKKTGALQEIDKLRKEVFLCESWRWTKASIVHIPLLLYSLH